MAQSFTAHSGKADYSLRAHRHTLRLRHDVRLRSLYPNSLRRRASGGRETARQIFTDSLAAPLLSAPPRFALCSGTAFSTFSHRQLRLRQCRLNALRTLIIRPTPGPSVWCADAQTPLRLSANHFTHSELAYGLGQGQVGLLSAVQAPQQKACRSVNSTTPAVCSNPDVGTPSSLRSFG